MKYKNILLLLCVILAGCKSTENTSVVTIRDLEPASDFSSILKSYRLIPLETTPESLIGGMIRKIVKTDEYIFVSSDFKRIHVFDKSGKFIFCHDAIGRGPEEYIQISDFDVFGGKLYILETDKLMIFEPTGAFIESVDLKIVSFNVEVLDEFNYLVCTSGMENILYVINNKGEIVKSYLDNKPSLRLGKSIPFTGLGNKLMFQMGYSNDVALYDLKKREFGEAKLTNSSKVMSSQEEEAMIKEYGSVKMDNPGILLIDGIVSSKNRIFFGMGNMNEFNIYIADIATGETLYIINQETKNDITFSGFLLDGVDVAKSDDDSFIGYVYPSDLSHAMQSYRGDQTDKQYLTIKNELLPTLQEDGNPVLIELIFN